MGAPTALPPLKPVFMGPGALPAWEGVIQPGTTLTGRVRNNTGTTRRVGLAVYLLRPNGVTWLWQANYLDVPSDGRFHGGFETADLSQGTLYVEAPDCSWQALLAAGMTFDQNSNAVTGRLIASGTGALGMPCT